MRAAAVAAGVVVSVAVSVAIAGCSSVTSGQGHGASPGVSSSRPDFPSTTATTPAPTSPSTTSPPPSPSPQTTDERARQLDVQSGGQASVLVRVRGGFEAATYDQSGHIRFWFEPTEAATWELVGRSRYPDIAQLGPPHATTQGALLRNMADATFIVRGTFSGDGSGNAVAFTDGRQGWGAIKAEPNGNIGPSGRPVGADLIGLSYDFGFRDGYLVTKDCPANRPISECDQHPVVKEWVWAGHDFVRV